MKKNLFTSACMILCTLFLNTGCLSAKSVEKSVSQTQNSLITGSSQELHQKEINKVFSDYSATVVYNPTVCPGDPLIVRLILTPYSNGAKKALTKKITAGTCYWSNAKPDKALRTAVLYQKNLWDKKRKSFQLLGAMPTSTYLECADYRVTVSWSIEGRKEETAEFTVTVSSKDFVSETIHLNATNTAIRTDASDERKLQIEKLNKILDTKNADSIYETEGFIYPTDVTRRTSFFGDRRVFAYNTGKSSTSLHYGIDWGAGTGSNVASCGRGKVVLAENRITTGWSVVIEHLPGLYSLYYHMSRLDVTEGQIVNKGQSLGLSGATGLATGPHIHWEVRLNMEAVDPEWFVLNSIW